MLTWHIYNNGVLPAVPIYIVAKVKYYEIRMELGGNFKSRMFCWLDIPIVI